MPAVFLLSLSLQPVSATVFLFPEALLWRNTHFGPLVETLSSREQVAAATPLPPHPGGYHSALAASSRWSAQHKRLALEVFPCDVVVD